MTLKILHIKLPNLGILSWKMVRFTIVSNCLGISVIFSVSRLFLKYAYAYTVLAIFFLIAIQMLDIRQMNW